MFLPSENDKNPETCIVCVCNSINEWASITPVIPNYFFSIFIKLVSIICKKYYNFLITIPDISNSGEMEKWNTISI